MYRVLITAPSFEKENSLPLRLLDEAGCAVDVIGGVQNITEEELIVALADYDAVIAGLERYTEQIIKNSKRLKVICRYGVGYDNVDTDAALRHGVAVTYTPTANTDSMADLAVAIMLSCARRIPQMHSRAKLGINKRVMGYEMWKKTLGVIGVGRIGKAVIKRLFGFNMNVLAFDKYPDERFAKDNNVRYCALEELLSLSDFVTIHCLYNAETRNMIDKKRIALMKPTAVLVNTARGGIINESDLYDALRDGIIAGAGLDVTESEPPIGNPLLELENCVLTSHIGSYTTDAIHNMSMNSVQNVVAVLHGRVCAERIV
ncbi:MAG: phosphoglycerate dehydrogenase [Clostridiales bacterium]|jgi:D-3-phosphoglycerate dehydrogenase|nr:phosphoglycerate dehydrogenase [Clostridiales bacterium]